METNRRSIVGLILVILGVYFLLENFDLMPFTLPAYLFQWQMILVVIGIINLISGNRRGALFFIGLGVLFFVTDEFNLDFGDLWPVILIIIGLTFFFRNKTIAREQDIESPIIDAVAILGGGKRNILSENFQGGKITTFFGGNVIDLRNAKLASTGAVIDISTAFGGTEIIVPREWSVESHVTPILGGYDDKRNDLSQVDEQKRLKLRGTVMFGGVDVKD